jgi:SAM-dependent methyltransferase
MLKLARENGAGGKLHLVQGAAERPPFKTAVFDRVMCKGALDHFLDPALCISSIFRSLKPGGKLVVAVANFESLSSRLARIFSFVVRILRGKEGNSRKFWDPPEDHLYVFHYANLRRLLDGPLVLEKMEGISIMWGFPWWGSLLERLPRHIARGILNLSGRIAARAPSLGDVIVAVSRR